ncbi:MAG: hypothetical protein ACLP59_22060 [Bryobacteraceae bacterium]
MTMKLEIPPEVEAGLIAEANENGMTIKAFVERVLRERAEVHEAVKAGTASEPFWKSFTRQVHALPGAVFERLPSDGANEHDHYLYGAPKRNA